MTFTSESPDDWSEQKTRIFNCSNLLLELPSTFIFYSNAQECCSFGFCFLSPAELNTLLLSEQVGIWVSRYNDPPFQTGSASQLEDFAAYYLQLNHLESEKVALQDYTYYLNPASKQDYYFADFLLPQDNGYYVIRFIYAAADYEYFAANAAGWLDTIRLLPEQIIEDNSAFYPQGGDRQIFEAFDLRISVPTYFELDPGLVVDDFNFVYRQGFTLYSQDSFIYFSKYEYDPYGTDNFFLPEDAAEMSLKQLADYYYFLYGKPNTLLNADGYYYFETNDSYAVYEPYLHTITYDYLVAIFNTTDAVWVLEFECAAHNHNYLFPMYYQCLQSVEFTATPPLQIPDDTPKGVY